MGFHLKTEMKNVLGQTNDKKTLFLRINVLDVIISSWILFD